MLGGGAGEYAADLADQGAIHPQAAGLIEEVAHLRRHVAEPGRGAEDDGIVVGQLGRLGDRRRLIEPDAGLARGVLGHQLRDPLDGYVGAADAFGAFRDGVCHRLDMAIARIVENQNLGHHLPPDVPAAGLCQPLR